MIGSRTVTVLGLAILMNAGAQFDNGVRALIDDDKIPDSLAVFAHFDSLDAEARIRYRDQKITEHRRSGGPFHYVHTVYLLTSGRLAFPFTATLTERDRVRLAIMKPKGIPVLSRVTSCGESVFDRVLEPAPTETGTKALSVSPFPKDSFELVDLPTVARCADSVRFEIRSIHNVGSIGFVSRTATTLSSDHAYLYALGGGYGYDMAKPRHITVDTRPNKQVDGNEQYLRFSKDRIGPGTFLSMGFRPCGLNPREVRIFGVKWKDPSSAICAPLSPTFIVPTTRSLNAFAVAFPVLSAYGSEIVVGGSFSQFDRLKSDVNAAIADTAKYVGNGRAYTLAGDPPVSHTWGRPGAGWFLGFSTSTAAIKAFFSPAEGTQKTANSTQEGKKEEPKPSGK